MKSLDPKPSRREAKREFSRVPTGIGNATAPKHFYEDKKAMEMIGNQYEGARL
jgi:hypothetical protein